MKVIPFALSLLCGLWAFSLELKGLPPNDQVIMCFVFGVWACLK